MMKTDFTKNRFGMGRSLGRYQAHVGGARLPRTWFRIRYMLLAMTLIAVSFAGLFGYQWYHLDPAPPVAAAPAASLVSSGTSALPSFVPQAAEEMPEVQFEFYETLPKMQVS